MAVVAKKDIEILTQQLLHERRNILETIKQEYIEIDPALLHANFVQEFEEKMSKINESHDGSIDDVPISLDDVEAIVSRFDGLDKKLTDTKPPPPPPINTTIRKENHGMKRFGSMTDMNKTMMRSLSSQSLNSTKTFIEPVAAPPRMAHHHNVNHENASVTPKLTTDEIINHNAIIKDIEKRLNAEHTDGNSYEQLLSDISQTYTSSFERLNGFFAEVQKIQTNKMVESKDDNLLAGLDQDLLNLMEKLSKALSQIRFIAEHQNIYNIDGIKAIDPLLSDDLTDILEHFYRTIK